MEENTTSCETEGETTFTIELDASQIYSLNTILRYNIINMDHPLYSHACEGLAKEIHEVISSEEYKQAMESQMEAVDEDMMRGSGSVGQMNMSSNGHGVQ